ncbi:AI-2E family transporter [Clostridiisalibacter paucivorans]|uniref:AI-2E family transporter n=1 Tax=Clostridiisalibacter paucivorans TaxID=408753 RepID=UPI00047CA44A|nr:AI-2E family transporter [Clostridiisalibacter paucivorans]
MNEKRYTIPYKSIIPLLLIAFILFKIIDSIDNIDWLMKALSPFIWAFTIAYLLNPMIKTIEKNYNVNRGWSILISYVIVLSIIVFVITIITPNIVKSISNLVDNISDYGQRTQKFFEETVYNIEILNRFGIMDYLESKLGEILQTSSEIIKTVLNEILTQAINITSSVLRFIISVTISIYLLKDKENFIYKIKRLLHAMLSSRMAERVIESSREVNDIFSRYLIGKLIDSIIIGIICFLILSIIKIPYAILISLIVGITNMIPYFGPIIGAVPAFILTLFSGPIKAFWVLVVIFILQQFDGLYLGPKILGRKVGVKPFWVISAITLGGSLFGVVGMLLGVPAIAVIRLLVDRYVSKRLDEKGVNLQKYKDNK